VSPADGAQVWGDSLRLSADAVSGGSGYQFELDYWDGTRWRDYYEYDVSRPAKTIWPHMEDTTYRVRVRARTAAGWGPYSAWNRIRYGNTSLPGGTSGGGTSGGTSGGTAVPGGLAPSDGAQIWGDAVDLGADEVSGGTDYQFELDYWDGTSWRDYYEYDVSRPAKTIWPHVEDNAYRVRVRARTSAGWGSFSDWNVFLFGNASYPNQSGTTGGSTGGGTSQPTSNAPTGATPANEQRIWSDDVTMQCDAVSGASEYHFQIEYHDGTGWRGYYEYDASSHSKTFWPYADNTPYRWRVRAYTSSGWTDFTSWNVFLFGNASSP
jgi:hypothetical protein